MHRAFAVAALMVVLEGLAAAAPGKMTQRGAIRLRWGFSYEGDFGSLAG